jgi:hypothetical protein
MNYYKEGMVSFMHSNPGSFERAIELALSDKQPFNWRSAWLLHGCMENNDPRLKEHVTSIILAIETKKGGHQRELLKILLKMELDDDQEGMLFDTCLGIWEQTRLQPSIRYTAFCFILNVARKHPDLISEIKFLTGQQYLDTLSPGIKNSVKKMIENFKG